MDELLIAICDAFGQTLYGPIKRRLKSGPRFLVDMPGDQLNDIFWVPFADQSPQHVDRSVFSIVTILAQTGQILVVIVPRLSTAAVDDMMDVERDIDGCATLTLE